MVLSSEEISILNGLIESTHNVSTYSYEIAVKGTVVSGIASVVCSLIALIITFVAARKLWTWAKNERDGEAVGIAVFVSFGVLVGSIITMYLMFYDPFMSIFAPEYTVIKMILQAAAGAT